MFPNTPFAKPDDRWSQAMWIVEHGRYATRKRYDEITRRAVYYIRRLRRATTERVARSAAKIFPEIYLALKVATEDGLRPLEIKARLLTGQSDAAIAKAVALPVPTVAAFAALFFDVRERLKATTWITQLAIGLPSQEIPSVQAIMLLHTYHRGPTVIEPWLDYLKHIGENHDLQMEQGRQRASLDLLVDIHQLPEDEQTWKTLQRVCVFALSWPYKTVRNTTVKAAFSQNRAKMVSETAWNGPSESAFSTSPLATNSAVHGAFTTSKVI